MSPPDALLDSRLETAMTDNDRLRVTVSRLEADNALLHAKLAVTEDERDRAMADRDAARAQLQGVQLRSSLDCCHAAMREALLTHFREAHPDDLVRRALAYDSTEVPS
jgi:hypothetical protein